MRWYGRRWFNISARWAGEHTLALTFDRAFELDSCSQPGAARQPRGSYASTDEQGDDSDGEINSAEVAREVVAR